MKRALLLLVSTAALACSTDPEESETTFGSGDGSASASSTPTTTEGLDTDTDDGSTSVDSMSTTSDSTTDASTTAAEPECGNGMREGDEECDDGNESDFDDCLTTCEIPTCDDGVAGGDETDVDCGGPCVPCAECLGCQFDTDCESGVCNEQDRCGYQQRLEIDARANCWSTTEFANNVVIEDVPAGMFEAVAAPSGWTAFSSPWNPPSTGWTWFVECIGVEFTQMRTPGETRYADPNEAFDAIIAADKREEFQWPGGDFSCGRQDTTCADNSGSVIFDINLICPDPGA